MCLIFISSVLLNSQKMLNFKYWSRASYVFAYFNQYEGREIGYEISFVKFLSRRLTLHKFEVLMHSVHNCFGSIVCNDSKSQSVS
jgi:hypothetical protein